MNSMSDGLIRSVALEKAVSIAHIIGQDQIVEYAEMFRKFLSEGEPDQTESVFTLPKVGDGYLYFQFSGSLVFYRLDTSHGADVLGGVDRINSRYEVTWSPVTATHLNTRTKLRKQSGYDEVTAVHAARVLRRHIVGVRFE